MLAIGYRIRRFDPGWKTTRSGSPRICQGDKVILKLWFAIDNAIDVKPSDFCVEPLAAM